MRYTQTAGKKMEFIRSWVVPVPIALTVLVLDEPQTTNPRRSRHLVVYSTVQSEEGLRVIALIRSMVVFAAIACHKSKIGHNEIMRGVCTLHGGTFNDATCCRRVVSGSGIGST
jgi:hypothetical protein